MKHSKGARGQHEGAGCARHRALWWAASVLPLQPFCALAAFFRRA